MVQERVIYFTNDADGVHRSGFSPVTAFKMLARKLDIPNIPEVIPPYVANTGLMHRLEHWIHLQWHKSMPVIIDGARGIESFRVAARINERQLRTALLTGRELYKHDLTKEQFGSEPYKFDELFLNPGIDSARWKGFKTAKLVAEGYNVVHIDDDLRAGLCVVGKNERQDGENRVLVYVVRNHILKDFMVKRSGLALPDNLVVVNNFQAASWDFNKRLEDHWF